MELLEGILLTLTRHRKEVGTMPLRIVDYQGLGFTVDTNPDFYESLYETLMKLEEVVVVKQ